MDMEVNSFPGSKEAVRMLNEATVDGFEILSVRVLPEGSKNAMASVAAAGYTIHFREGREPSFDWKKEFPSFMEKEQILITKETKKSTAEVDLRPGIYEWSLQEDALYLLINASSSGNIKPGMIVEAFLQEHGESLKENALLITREDTYTNIGDEENPKLVPLEEIGSEQ